MPEEAPTQGGRLRRRGAAVRTEELLLRSLITRAGSLLKGALGKWGFDTHGAR